MLSVLVGGGAVTRFHQPPTIKVRPCISSEKSSSFHTTEFFRLVTSSFGHKAKPSDVLCSPAVWSRLDLATLVLLFRVFFFTKTGNSCFLVNKI